MTSIRNTKCQGYNKNVCLWSNNICYTKTIFEVKYVIPAFLNIVHVIYKYNVRYIYFDVNSNKCATALIS